VNDEQRIRQLVGDGSGGGGLTGVPLPDAFGKILELLLDNRTATSEELAKAVSSTLEWKKAAVFAVFPNWKIFTKALTGQLAAGGFITTVGTDSIFTATDKAVPGASLLIIPEGDIRVTVHTAGQRDVLNKISEVRAGAVEHDVLTREMDRYLDEITNTVDRKRSKRLAHAGSITPLEDEPEHVRMCVGCFKDYLLTQENFSQYKSRVEHYWNRKCAACRKDAEAQARAEKKEATRIKIAMTRFIGPDGDYTVGEVMIHLAVHDAQLIRRYWDDLASLGKVPSRKS
jgi:hypothetical protein